MKSILTLAVCLLSTLLGSNANTFSKDRLEGFYDVFLCEEKQELAAVGLTSPCSVVPGSGSYSPPPDPPAPPFMTGLVPVVLVNNSGYPDSQVFIVITGNDPSNGHQAWGNINGATGVVTVQDVANGDSSTTFTKALSSLPQGSTGRIFYMPPMSSSLFWFSMVNELHMTVTGLAIVQPNFTNSGDADYYTNYDLFEFAYVVGGNPPVNADATAVSFFSIPLYGYLAGATSVSSHTGLYQPRCYVMSAAASVISANAHSPATAQWNNLFLQSGGRILRFLSTGKAISASIFDINYLDNAASYGYSYISDVWNGAGSYYKTNMLSLTASVTFPSAATWDYMGQVNGSNEFVFTSTNGGPTVTFIAPTVASVTPTATTSFYIFSNINLAMPTLPYPTAGSAADVVSRLFQQAIIAGLLPTTNNLSLSYIQSNQANYYNVNSLLRGSGQSTGPWYDLYSKALHSVGSIYTSGYDETLWPQVLLGGPFVNDSTYLGITIGNVTESCSH
jgi:hypothetical protein